MTMSSAQTLESIIALIDFHHQRALEATTFNQFYLHKQWIIILNHELIGTRMGFAKSHAEHLRNAAQRKKDDEHIRALWNQRILHFKPIESPQPTHLAVDPRPPRIV